MAQRLKWVWPVRADRTIIPASGDARCQHQARDDPRDRRGWLPRAAAFAGSWRVVQMATTSNSGSAAYGRWTRSLMSPLPCRRIMCSQRSDDWRKQLAAVHASRVRSPGGATSRIQSEHDSDVARQIRSCLAGTKVATNSVHPGSTAPRRSSRRGSRRHTTTRLRRNARSIRCVDAGAGWPGTWGHRGASWRWVRADCAPWRIRVTCCRCSSLFIPNVPVGTPWFRVRCCLASRTALEAGRLAQSSKHTLRSLRVRRFGRQDRAQLPVISSSYIFAHPRL